ncbi:hypothetical protein SEVIR_7G076150v4 [Setaria viridis]
MGTVPVTIIRPCHTLALPLHFLSFVLSCLNDSRPDVPKLELNHFKQRYGPGGVRQVRVCDMGGGRDQTCDQKLPEQFPVRRTSHCDRASLSLQLKRQDIKIREMRELTHLIDYSLISMSPSSREPAGEHRRKANFEPQD